MNFRIRKLTLLLLNPRLDLLLLSKASWLKNGLCLKRIKNAFSVEILLAWGFFMLKSITVSFVTGEYAQSARRSVRITRKKRRI